MAPWMQFPVCPPAEGQRPECHLTTLFGTAAVPTAPPVDAPVARKKRGWLPLLTVSVPDLLWLDDHADRGAGTDHRIAARADPRVLSRQHRTDRPEKKARRKRVCRRSAPGPDSGGENPSSVTQSPSTQYPSTQAPPSRPRLPRRHHNTVPSWKKRNHSSRCRRSRCPIESTTHALSSRCNARLRKRSQNTTKPEQQFCG